MDTFIPKKHQFREALRSFFKIKETADESLRLLVEDYIHTLPVPLLFSIFK